MMTLYIKQVALWIHLLCMLGCFGMVLAATIAAKSHTKETLSKDSTLKMAALTLAGGLLAGIVVFILKVRMFKELPPSFMMFIMIKFFLLVCAGGALATASKKASQGDASGSQLGRTIALLALASAALLGVFLQPTI
ncbi:MAG: hypothetical protein OSB41_02315 [Kiritimatiellae bacterium]|nr:hypothetical protein [Kiritimatiellia bacterium]